jgi:hypothetical protein
LRSRRRGEGIPRLPAETLASEISVSIWPSQPLHRARTAAAFPELSASEGRQQVTGSSVLVIAPWAVFAASLVVLCLRMRKFRR